MQNEMWATSFAKFVFEENVKAVFHFTSSTENDSRILLLNAKLGEITVWEIWKMNIRHKLKVPGNLLKLPPDKQQKLPVPDNPQELALCAGQPAGSPPVPDNLLQNFLAKPDSLPPGSISSFGWEFDLFNKPSNKQISKNAYVLLFTLLQQSFAMLLLLYCQMAQLKGSGPHLSKSLCCLLSNTTWQKTQGVPDWYL